MKMKNLICVLVAVFAFQTISFAQLVGDRLQVGQVYTFQSESDGNLYISYGSEEGRAGMNATNKNFKVVAPLNGKAGSVSLQAVDLPGTVYLVMGADCPYPYGGSNFYDVKSKSGDQNTFNNNASFAISHGKSNMGEASLVSFITSKGHFLKRERGVLMGQTGAGVAPRYQNHFTFKFTPTSRNSLAAGETLKAGERLMSANGKYILRMQADDGNLCVYNFANGQQGRFVWGSMKYGFKNGELKMQTDGNLCVYGGGAFKWGSYQVKKYALGANYKLVLTNEGKLNIMNGSGDVVWTN
jgi:hypothetical protein